MAHGTGGTLWIKLLIGGCAAVISAHALEHFAGGPGWLVAAGFAAGGLAIVFASCEAMILSVEGIGSRAGWNPYVAGTMGGLAANIPEIVMLGFVLAATPRVGFIVVVFTLHVGALLFGIYSGLLPRDATGQARMPKPLVGLSTDLYACAAGVFLALGLLMVSMRVFLGRGDAAHPVELTVTDVYVIGVLLLSVQSVAVWRLVARFAGGGDPAEEGAGPPPSVAAIVRYGAIGIAASVFGGHAVGNFADTLVTSLEAAGYSEMVSALVLSVFASSGAFAMVFTAHTSGKHDIALANASGGITQVPFVVLPLALIMIGAFAQTGIVPALPGGGALPIDLETTTVVLLGAPPLLVLWKAVQDDGAVNWVETASLFAIFGLTIYLLAVHG